MLVIAWGFSFNNWEYLSPFLSVVWLDRYGLECHTESDVSLCNLQGMQGFFGSRKVFITLCVHIVLLSNLTLDTSNIANAVNWVSVYNVNV